MSMEQVLRFNGIMPPATAAQEVYQCVCEACGKRFPSTKLVSIYGAEYPGAASSWLGYESPCCGADVE